MKVRKIAIMPKEDFNNDLLRAAALLDKGRKTPRLRGTYFESLEAVRNVLTDKRLELWRTIRDREVKSISQLGQIVKRDLKSIHRDLAVLETIGLIKLQSGKGSRGDVTKPISLADELRLSVA